MINIAICDDEEVFSSEIEYLINKYYDSDITYKVNIFNDPFKMLDYSINNKIDILFMDIEMPKINGIELVKKIKEVSDNCIIFFVTSHSAYITDIFRLGSFQFLQKPINEKDFKIDLNRALSHYKKNHTNLEIVTNGTIRNIFIGDILYIEVYKKEIRINLKNEVITHYGSLNQYEAKLKGYSFSKPHKSFLVNLKYIAKFDSSNVYLFNKTQIPLTRNYKDDFLLDFNKFIRGKCL